MGTTRKHAKVKQEVVLGIMAASADRRSLNEILCGAGWRLEVCDSLTEARPHLYDASVVLCDERLPDGNWKDVLALLAPLPLNPALIVASRLADEPLWAEVLNLGGYDLLLKPFRAQEVVRTVATACDSLSRTQNTLAEAVH